MKKSLLFILFLIVLTDKSWTQSYHSDFERNAISELKSSDETSLINALLAIDKGMTSEKAKDVLATVNEFYDKLDPVNLRKKPLKQIAKKVFASVHDKFFKRYELVASFDQIFSDGIFNCVSATAFYYIIFKRLDVPVEIISEPGHVYMTIGKDSEKITIESTDPVNGYKSSSMSNKIKAEYVTTLMDAKIIARDQYIGMNNSQIYDLIFNVENVIEPSVLVSFQYQNEGIIYLASEKFQATANSFEKAMSIDTSTQIKLVLQVVYAKILANYDESKENPGKMISYVEGYLNVSDSLNSKQENAASDEVCRLLYNYLIKKSKVDSAGYYYKKVMTGKMKDFPAVGNRIRTCYNHELARYYILLRQPEKSFSPLIEAYSVEPSNVLYSTSVFEAMKDNYYDDMGSDVLAKIVDSTCRDCECCLQTRQYLDVHLKFLKVQELTEDEKIDDALKILDEAEALLIGLEMTKINADIFSEAYQGIFAYYTQLRMYEKGNLYLKRGLALSPENKYLQYLVKVSDEFENKK